MERCLAGTGWIAGTRRESMADLALACEAEQLSFIGYNLADYPNVQAWLAKLRKIPQYNEVRAMGRLGSPESATPSTHWNCAPHAARTAPCVRC